MPFFAVLIYTGCSISIPKSVKGTKKIIKQSELISNSVVGPQ